MWNGIFYLSNNIFREAAADSIRGLLFVMVCLFIGVAVHFGSKKYHYAYTVGCFLFGVIVGVIEVNISVHSSVVTHMNPSDVLLVFLPVLIFESSFGMEAHMFYKALPQCLTLAVVGFVFCTALTAVFAKYVLAVYGWSWLTALVFGVILSATDPVAVVALLKDMKMPHTFTVLIEGESLLNDGVAIVMYEMLTHQIISGKPFEIGTTSIELLKTCIGAPILGYMLGKMTESILIRIYISPVSEMTTIFVLAYITYFVAEEIFGISAVIAVVLYGITLSSNRMCISPESEALIHTDWRLLAVYANTLIFITVGILVIDSFSEFFHLQDAWLILQTYVVLTILRSIMITIFYPVLRKYGYGLNWKKSIILSWGGLRGAIGLALALMLASDPRVPDSENAKKVLIQVSGIIVLTLVVNANSTKYVMNLINFKEITLVNRLSMGNAIASVSEIKEKSLRICKGEWKFMKANWEWVSERTKLDDPYEGGLHGEDPDIKSLFVPYGTCNECLVTILPREPTSEEVNELTEATRKKVLRALKGSLWKLFRKGLLQRRSLRLLCMAANNVSDVRHKYLTTEDVKRKFMKVSKLNHWLETILSRLIKRLKLKKNTEFELEMNHLKPAKNGSFRSLCLWIYLSRYFEPTVFVVVVSHVAHIIMDVYLIVSGIEEYHDAMYFLAIFYIVFYIMEIAVKVSALKWHFYIKLPWNKVDFATSLLTISEGILDVILVKHFLKHYLPLHTRIFIIIRTFRYFYILVNIFIAILSLIRNHASSDLYYAYDIGRGFLFATDAVLKNINMIVDFGPCAEVPVRVFERNIREMLDILDEFERNYPAVAVALKSNRAARKILNRVKDVMDQLQKGSIILEEDARKMKLILFKMTKTVVYAPRARIFIRDILKLLNEVNWINLELSKYIHENHVIVTYDSGDIIQKAGENHEFVFIIAKGFIEIIGERDDEDGGESQSQLPNIDSPLYFQTQTGKSFQDYMTMSGTIGLLGYLQKTPSLTSAVCQTDCELIRIEHSCLDDAREKFDDVIFCMWKSISIEIGLQLLKKQHRYKKLSDVDMHLRLEKAILPNLTKVTSLELPVFVEDAIVIQGHIVDAKSEEKFISPSYIPNSSRKFTLLDDVNRRSPVIILCLLGKKYWFHNCNNWVDPEKMCQDAALCLSDVAKT